MSEKLVPDLPFWTEPVFQGFLLAHVVRVESKPKGKGSVRVVRKKRGDGVRGIPDPGSSAFEDLVTLLARHQRPRNDFRTPLQGPLLLRAIAIFRRKKTFREKDHEPVDLPGQEGRFWYMPKPDWDNLGKSAGDGLVKALVLPDDCKIVHGSVCKVWGREDEPSALEVALFARRVA